MKNLLLWFILCCAALAQDVVTVSIAPPLTNGKPTTSVKFVGTVASSVGAKITTWSWNFGDGIVCTYSATYCFLTISHNYPKVGSYLITLTATDANGTKGSGTATVNVFSDMANATLSVISGNQEPIGLPVLYSYTASSLAGVLTSLTLDCGDGTTQTQSLFHQTGTGLVIQGVRSTTASWICNPSQVGTLTPKLTVVDSLGATATATTTNTTLPIPACGGPVDFTYQLPAWQKALNWTNPADVMYQSTQYTTKTVTITSWTTDGSTVTFQAVNSFTGGEIVTLAKFLTSTFFNTQKVTVLTTGLSPTQFEVSYVGATGTSDSGSGSFSTLAQVNTNSLFLPYTYSITNYGKPYCLFLGAGGGTPPYTFSATGLPPGLTVQQLSPTQGLLSGGITAIGNYNVTLTVTDSVGATSVLNPRILNVCDALAPCGNIIGNLIP